MNRVSVLKKRISAADRFEVHTGLSPPVISPVCLRYPYAHSSFYGSGRNQGFYTCAIGKAGRRNVRVMQRHTCYMMMHTSPPLLSLTIFCMVSCSFSWLSSLIIAILFCIPSITSSSIDLPKIFVPQIPSSLSFASLI